MATLVLVNSTGSYTATSLTPVSFTTGGTALAPYTPERIALVNADGSYWFFVPQRVIQSVSTPLVAAPQVGFVRTLGYLPQMPTVAEPSSTIVSRPAQWVTVAEPVGAVFLSASGLVLRPVQRVPVTGDVQGVVVPGTDMVLRYAQWIPFSGVIRAVVKPNIRQQSRKIILQRIRMTGRVGCRVQPRASTA